MLAVAYATSRASHARQVKDDDPEIKGYPGPPGWVFGAGLTALSCENQNVAKNSVNETGPPSWKRLTMRSKEMNMVMQFGTWNVRTLLQAGNMNAIAEEAERYKMDAVPLQEIRWKAKGTIRKSKFTMYYSGNEDRQGNRGVGFIVSKKLINWYWDSCLSVKEYVPCKLKVNYIILHLSMYMHRLKIPRMK